MDITVLVWWKTSQPLCNTFISFKYTTDTDHVPLYIFAFVMEKLIMCDIIYWIEVYLFHFLILK
jgi:hypothetical protein